MPYLCERFRFGIPIELSSCHSARRTSRTGESAQRFTIRASGLPGLAVAGVAQPVAVDGAAVRTVPIRLQAPAEAAPPGPHKIVIEVASVDDAALRRDERSTFILPRP